MQSRRSPLAKAASRKERCGSLQLNVTERRRSFSRRNFCFSASCSIVFCGSHWKGVKGLGTKDEVLTLTRSPFWRISLGTEKYSSTTALARLAMPSRSSLVSVGRPHMV